MDEQIKYLVNNNEQGEFYLTDLVGISKEKNLSMGYLVAENSEEFDGINTIAQLNAARVSQMVGNGKRA